MYLFSSVWNPSIALIKLSVHFLQIVQLSVYLITKRLTLFTTD